tara:strand:- start:521 stop:733 length:213 start_codon:yes stop_codon:yes gene_type:complete
MANEKFEAGEIITDTEVRLECLRLATEFGPENDRRNPLPIAEVYLAWVTKNSGRQFCKCETSKKKDKVKS